MIAKVQVARQELAMVEDDYRQLLLDTTGHLSLRECTDAQLSAMIRALCEKGFRPLPKGRGSRGAAAHPMARKARALWISLHQLGVVHNPAEEALEAFAQRQLGCDRLVWARQSDGHRLIEALKDMGRRAGWRMNHLGTHRPMSSLELQQSLCCAILDKLKAAGVAPADWALHEAAWRLCGIENAREWGWTAENYHQLAGALGAVLREQAPRAVRS